MKRQGIWLGLILMTFFNLFALGLADSVRGPVYPGLLQVFGLSNTIGSLFFWTSSILSVGNNLLAFLWLRRLGAFRALQIYTLIHFISLLVLGISTTYSQVLLGTGLLGIAMGGMGVAENLLVAAAAPPAHRRRVLSALHAMYGLSSLLGPLIMNLWLVHSENVKLSGPQVYLGLFPWLGIASVLSIGSTFFIRPPKQDEVEVGLGFQVDPKDEVGVRRYMLIFAFVLAVYVMAELAISSRLTLFCIEAAGLDHAASNRWLSLFFLSMTGGRLLFAILPLRISHRRVLIISALLTMLFSLWGVLASNPLPLVISGLAMAGIYPTLMTMMAEAMGKNAGYVVASSMGLQGLGVAFMHVGIGAFADVSGIRVALISVPVMMLITAVTLMLNPSLEGKK